MSNEHSIEQLLAVQPTPIAGASNKYYVRTNISEDIGLVRDVFAEVAHTGAAGKQAMDTMTLDWVTTNTAGRRTLAEFDIDPHSAVFIAANNRLAALPGTRQEQLDAVGVTVPQTDDQWTYLVIEPRCGFPLTNEDYHIVTTGRTLSTICDAWYAEMVGYRVAPVRRLAGKRTTVGIRGDMQPHPA